MNFEILANLTESFKSEPRLRSDFHEGTPKYNINIIIKYQTPDIEFLVIWLALYSRYKSYILQFVQIGKLTNLSRKISPQNCRKLK